MKVIVNGEHKEYEFDKISVLDLLRLNNVKNPDVVVVQINGNVCEKEFYFLLLLKMVMKLILYILLEEVSEG
jgi:sulfur carrier protein ThiS